MMIRLDNDAARHQSSHAHGAPPRSPRGGAWLRLVPALVSLGVFACAHEEPRQTTMEIAEVSHELGLGDRGPEVAAVYERLRQYGYLPSAELERNFPYWAPVIDQEAEDPALFGDVHATALRAFQRQAGLPETGRVDARSLSVLKQPRCGHPENELALFDPREKWDLIEDPERIRLLTSASVSWFVTSCHDNGSNFCETLATNFNAGPSGNASSLERTAFNVWQNETNKTFNRLPGCAEPCIPLIEIRYYSNVNKDSSSPHFASSLTSWPRFSSSDTLAFATNGPLNNWIIAVNSAQAWTVDKLREVLAHEIGHVLSIGHSSVTQGALAPISSRNLSVSPYTRCDNATLPCKTSAGGARSFPAGSSLRALMGAAWLLNADRPEDSTNNPQVLTVDDRLAASTLWGTWKLLPGLATDIGVGGPMTTSATPPAVRLPDVWVTSGNNTVWKMSANGGAFNQDTGANANGIAVSVTPSGIPWTVASNGQVRSRSNATCTTNPCTGTWTTRGATNARDIGIGGGSDTACVDNGTRHPCVWIISTSALNGNFQVRRWNGTSFTSPGTAFQGTRITVDRNGFPIVMKADGTIFTNESLTGSASWTPVQGSAPGPLGCATDIGAGLNGGLYAIGCASAGSGNFDVWALGINKANIFDQRDTLNRSVWWPTDGIGTRVAVGPEGRAYVVQAGGGIFRRDAK